MFIITRRTNFPGSVSVGFGCLSQPGHGKTNQARPLWTRRNAARLTHGNGRLLPCSLCVEGELPLAAGDGDLFKSIQWFLTLVPDPTDKSSIQYYRPAGVAGFTGANPDFALWDHRRDLFSFLFSLPQSTHRYWWLLRSAPIINRLSSRF